MTTRQDEANVDELRQRLRSLGYLDAGVDRFVLGPARETRRPLAIAALASVRIGALAALLLGPAVAVGMGARLPGLVTGPRDAIVIALYLGLLFGIAAATISFVASLIVTRLPLPVVSARPRLVSRGAGVIVGGATLLYLTLWWRIANADAAGLSPLWTAFVLAIAVAISLLLGHATTITAFAALAVGRSRSAPALSERSESNGPALSERSESNGWRLTAAAAALAFIAAAGLLVMAAPSAETEAPPPSLAVVSPGVRVTVLAIDGLDPAVLDALVPTGTIPNLARLVANGTVRLPADAVRDPAREWTTIATGQPPDVHGVHGLETRRVAGVQGTMTTGADQGLVAALRQVTDVLRLTRRSTASGTELRAKTIWEVAADAGLRAAVVNWWATWPATTAGSNPPIVVSDRATLRLDRGGDLDGEIAPVEVYERLGREWPAIRQEAESATRALPPAGDEGVAAALTRAAQVDAVQLAIASRLEAPALDLLAIYLPGLDIAQHALLGSGNPVSPSALTARLESLRGYYRFLDTLLADVANPGEGELVFLIAQPGRIATITHGLAAAAGDHVATGIDLEGRTTSLAPTILHALGIPVSRELVERPLMRMFTEDFRKRFPAREAESYGRRTLPSALREGQPLDREMIERLRSLGYVR